jgi:hypothetical protein
VTGAIPLRVIYCMQNARVILDGYQSESTASFIDVCLVLYGYGYWFNLMAKPLKLSGLGDAAISF